MPDSLFSKNLQEIGRQAVVSQDPQNPNQQFESDRRNLSSSEFTRKYGREAYLDRVFAAPEENLDPVRLQRERSIKRTGDELLNDYSRQFGAGAVQGTAGLVNFGITTATNLNPALSNPLLQPLKKSFVDPVAAQAKLKIAQFGDAAAQGLLEGESDTIKRQSEIAEQTKRAELADSDLIFQRSEGRLSDHLGRIGREFLIEGTNAFDNPSTVGKTVANATGSLVPSLVGSGGATSLAKLGLKAAKIGTDTFKGKAVTTAAAASAVGAVEGQGAYNQTVTKINKMTEAQLREGSELYNELRSQGQSHEEAKLEVGERAGIHAQKIQSAFASTVGLLASKLDAAPFAKIGTKAYVRESVKEGVEEGLQSAAGDFTGNLGIQKFADSNIDISKGIGISAFQGVLGGVGAASIIATPGNLRHALDSSKVNGAGFLQHVAKVRAGEARRRADNKSSVGEKATSENIDKLEVLLQDAEGISELQTVAQTDQATNIDPESLTEINDIANQTKNAPVWLRDTENEQFQKATALFKDDVVPQSRIKTLRKVLAKIKNGQYNDPATSKAAGAFAIEEIDALKELVENSNLNEETDPIEKASADLIGNIISNKLFSTGLDKATEILNADSTQPAGLKEAVLNPTAIDPQRISDERVATFAPEEQKAIQVIRAINSPSVEGESTQAALEKGKNTRKGTRKELLFNTKNTKYGSVPSFNELVSLALRGAIKQTRAGDTVVTNSNGERVDAQDSVNRLKNLIRHQLNKYEAASESLAFSEANPGADSKRQFRTLDPVTGEKFSSKEKGSSIFVNARSPNSIETFNQVREDANTGIRAYNALLKQFPDVYQGDPIPELPPHTGIAARQDSQAQVQQPTEESIQEPSQEASQQADLFENTNDQSAQNTEEVSQETATEQPQQQDKVLDPDELSFNDLFNSGSEATLKEAISYLESLNNITDTQLELLDVIKNSKFTKINSETRVRLGNSNDTKPNSDIKGWWDPVAQEIVLFDSSISTLLHEMVHATTLEALNQLLRTSYSNLKRPLTKEEKAAKRLLDLANQFVDSNQKSKKAKELQQLMKDLINEDLQRNDGVSGLVSAVNEFMAYGLTDSSIRDTLSNTKYTRPKLARRIIDGIKRILGISNTSTVLDRLFFDTKTVARANIENSAQPAQTQKTKAEDTASKSEPESSSNVEETPSQPVIEAQENTSVTQEEASTDREAQANQNEQTETESVVENSNDPEGIFNTEPRQLPPAKEVLTTIRDARTEIVSNSPGSIDIVFYPESAQASNDFYEYLQTVPDKKNSILERYIKSKLKDTVHKNEDILSQEISVQYDSVTISIQTGNLFNQDNSITNSPQSTSSVEAPSIEAVSETEVQPDTAAANAAPQAETAAQETASQSETFTEEVSSKPKTRLTQENTPLITNRNNESLLHKTYNISPILKADGDINTLIEEAEANKSLDYKITSEQKAALSGLLDIADNIIKALNRDLVKSLDSEYVKGGDSIRKVLLDIAAGKSDKKLLEQTGKMYNLLDADALAKGEFKYNDHLIKLAVLGSLDFIINEHTDPGKVKTEDILKTLAIPRKASKKVSNDASSVINFGLPVSDVKINLSNHIQSFWGASTNNNVSSTLTEGIAGSIAQEIIETLAENGNKLLDPAGKTEANPKNYWAQTQFKTVVIGTIVNKRGQESPDKRDFYSVRFGNKGSSLGAAKTILRDVLTSERNPKDASIGKKIAKVDDTVAKNKNILIPEKKRLSAKKQQDTPYTVSEDGLEFLDWLHPRDLSEGAVSPLAQILGWTDIEDGKFYTRAERIKKQGKNASIKRSINGTFDLLAKLEAYAEQHGGDWKKIPAYFKLAFTVNGRFQMQGFNPQGDKLARELFTPSETKLDINNRDDIDLFYAAVAQAFDLGDLKLQNVGLEFAADKAREILAGDYAKGLEAVHNKDTDALLDFINDPNIEVEPTARLLKALVAVDKLNKAIANGDKEVTVDLAVELDGQTNGPITSAIQNNTDPFIIGDLRTYARGGYFIGRTTDARGRALHYARWKKTGEDTKDFYEAIASDMGSILFKIKEDILSGALTGDPNSKANKIIYDAQKKALGLLRNLGDISFTPTKPDSEGNPTSFTIDIKRKASKGFITPKIYGSGLSAIAASLGNSIVQQFYDELGKAVNTGDNSNLLSIAKNLDQLLQIKIVKKKNKDLTAWIQKPEGASLTAVVERAFKNGKPTQDNVLSFLEDFEISNDQFDRLQATLEHTYLAAFQRAYDKNVGPSVAEVNKLKVEASTTISIIHGRIQSAALDKETKRQRKEGIIEKGHELSKNDRNRIINETSKFGLIIDTGSTILDINKEDGQTTSEVEALRNEQAELGIPAEDRLATFNPSSTSLRKKKTSSKRKAVSNPGVAIIPNTVISNADVDLITDTHADPRSQSDTLSVHDGVEINNFKRLQIMSELMNESINSTWTKNTIQPIVDAIDSIIELEPEAIETGANLLIGPVKGESPVNAFEVLRSLSIALQDRSDFRDAKIKAKNSFVNTIDGTPGAENPFVSKVGDNFAGSDETLIKNLNDIALAEYARIREAREQHQATYKDLIEKEDPKGSDFRKSLDKDTYSSGREIQEFVKKLKDNITNLDQKAVFKEITRNNIIKDIIEDGFVISIAPIGSGSYIDFDNKAIVLGNATTESALHELVHATTFKRIADHYANPEANKQRADAVARLEELAHDFIKKEYSEDSIEDYVKTIIQEQISNDNYQGAINEFLAWSLSNEALIKKNKNKVNKSALSSARALGRKGVEFMRRILGFSSNKVFDHILFNTAVILKSNPDANTEVSGILRHEIKNQNQVITPDQARKQRLQDLIGEQITSFLEGRIKNQSKVRSDAAKAERAADYREAEVNSLEALSRVQAAGFGIETVQDQLLFKSLQPILSLDLQLDKLRRLEVQKLFNKLTDQITLESVLKALGTDVENSNQTDQETAQNILSVLNGSSFTDTEGEVRTPEVNSKGVSNNLGTLLALAQTSEVFRDLLSNLDLQDLELRSLVDVSNLDSAIGSATEKAISSINNKILETGNSQSVESSLDVLTELLLSHEAEAAFELEQQGFNILSNINSKISESIDNISKQVGDKLRENQSETDVDSSIREDIAAIGNGVAIRLADLFNKDRSKAYSDDILSLLNDPKASETFRNLVGELKGITKDTAKVLNFVKAAKYQISSARQEFIETLPKIITNRFTPHFNIKTQEESNKQFKARKKEALKDMFHAFGKTDLSSIVDVFGKNFALNLFGSTKEKQIIRESAINEAKENIKQELSKLNLPDALAKKISNAYFIKAAQLGNYQVTNIVGKNLLTSADSIVRLNNEDNLSITVSEHKALKKAISDLAGKTNDNSAGIRGGLANLVKAIDSLASLEAVNQLSNDTHSRVNKLIKEESDGIKYTLASIKNLSQLENNKTDSDLARINGYKGYLDTSAKKKHSVIVALNSDEVSLREQGYIRVRDYNNGLTAKGGKRSYYFSAHQKLATYNQGALQTVTDSFFGIDPSTGLTKGPETTGELIRGDAAKLLNREIKSGRLNPPDGLLPRFDEEGALVGFEQVIAPDLIQKLKPNEDISQSIGRWAGRINEEKYAYEFNKSLIDALKEMYDSQKATRDGEFANFGLVVDEEGNSILDPEIENDPIWKESYKLIPKEVREYGEKVFGGPIKIRRDLINNTLGFRSPSVTDIFTGKSRLNKDLREALKDALISTPFLGPDILKYLTIAEDITQGVIGEVKHTIVVKSGIVMVLNTLNNIVQLAGRDVPLSYMGKRSRSKYAELEQFRKNQDTKIQLRNDILSTDSVLKQRAIQNKIDLLEEAERKMSIWPLIEANQFTTISEGLTGADKELLEGNFMDWVEEKAAELPGALSTVARYAIVSKDTALYKGLARAVQYSDFIAKAVYYDYMTENQGISKEEALGKIDQEFINYDLNDSRVRTGFESFGLTWFMNFKLRSMKIALDIARNNPASALFTLGTATAIGMNVGTPVTDNVASVAADGRLGYALGPGMVEAGWNLNIWNQIFGK